MGDRLWVRPRFHPPLEFSDGAIVGTPASPVQDSGVQTFGVGSTRRTSHPSEKERNTAAHDPILPSDRAGFLGGHGFG